MQEMTQMVGVYKLPELSESDWDQILTNTSIITFVQGIPIGLKYYNNYAIATSTSNKEYVDPNEIYMNNSSEYYHTKYCNQLGDSNLIGYRSIDYIAKEKRETEGYYYMHTPEQGTGDQSSQACYQCLIQRSLYIKDVTSEKTDAYQTALARERYVAKINEIPGQVVVNPAVPPIVGGPTYYIYTYGVPSNFIFERNSTNLGTITNHPDTEGANYTIYTNATIGEEAASVDTYRKYWRRIS